MAGSGSLVVVDSSVKVMILDRGCKDLGYLEGVGSGVSSAYFTTEARLIHSLTVL